MKIRKLIFALLLLLPVSAFSENVTLQFFTSRGEILEKEVNASIRLLMITEAFIPRSTVDEEVFIVDVSGFDQLKDLQILNVNALNNLSNFNFIGDIENLRELYIHFCFVDSIKFLEKMKKLEIAEISMYVMEDKKEQFISEQVDLSNAISLARINFHASVMSKEEDLLNFNNIPNLINVQNQPVLDIGSCGIETIGPEQRVQLKQYSQIYLWPNPIIRDELQIEALKDLNIVLK